MPNSLTVALLMSAAVLTAAAMASGQGRRTAVVNLAKDQSAGALAASQIRESLEKHPNLSPLRAGVLARALEEAVPTEGPEAAIIARARALLARAKTEFSSFRSSRALKVVRDAEATLLTIPMNATAQRLLADLAFFEGRVHLREQNRGFARSSYELVLRLVPDFPSPDPGRFDPDVVGTFKEAKAILAEPGGGTLEVGATYDGAEIYVDGVRVGVTPLAVTVKAGAHYVSAISPEHRIATRRVDVGDGDAVELDFDLVVLSPQDVALRLRVSALASRASAGGPPLWALARSVQALAGADSAVVVRGKAGELEVSVFRLTDERGAPFRTIDGGGLASAMAILSPVRTLRPDELFDIGNLPDPLYKRPEIIAGAVTGVVLFAVAITVFGVAASDNDPANRTGIPVGF